MGPVEKTDRQTHTHTRGGWVSSGLGRPGSGPHGPFPVGEGGQGPSGHQSSLAGTQGFQEVFPTSRVSHPCSSHRHHKRASARRAGSQRGPPARGHGEGGPCGSLGLFSGGSPGRGGLRALTVSAAAAWVEDTAGAKSGMWASCTGGEGGSRLGTGIRQVQQQVQAGSACRVGWRAHLASAHTGALLLSHWADICLGCSLAEILMLGTHPSRFPDPVGLPRGLPAVPGELWVGSLAAVCSPQGSLAQGLTMCWSEPGF